MAAPTRPSANAAQGTCGQPHCESPTEVERKFRELEQDLGCEPAGDGGEDLRASGSARGRGDHLELGDARSVLVAIG